MPFVQRAAAWGTSQQPASDGLGFYFLHLGNLTTGQEPPPVLGAVQRQQRRCPGKFTHHWEAEGGESTCGGRRRAGRRRPAWREGGCRAEREGQGPPDRSQPGGAERDGVGPLTSQRALGPGPVAGGPAAAEHEEAAVEGVGAAGERRVELQQEGAGPPAPPAAQLGGARQPGLAQPRRPPPHLAGELGAAQAPGGRLLREPQLHARAHPRGTTRGHRKWTVPQVVRPAPMPEVRAAETPPPYRKCELLQ